jgi:hypothetical protein
LDKIHEKKLISNYNMPSGKAFLSSSFYTSGFLVFIGMD